MLTHLLPLLLPIQNLTFCLEVVLDKSPYETVALVHSNTTVDIVDHIYCQLRKDRKFAWMRFNMDKYSNLEFTPLPDFVKKTFIGNVFFLYFFNLVEDFIKIFGLIHTDKVDYRDNHIYVVNNYTFFKSVGYIKALTDYAYDMGYFNLAFLFWNTSRQGFGIEAYMYPGFGKSFVKVPLDGDQCGRDFYDKVFFDKTISFDQDVIVIGRTEPPKTLKTVTTVNGKQEYSIGGYDVFIAETVLRHLRASPIYAISDDFFLYNKPDNNTERNFFNISQICRYNWTVINKNEAFKIRFSSFEIISEQTNYGFYMEHLLARSPTFLYPHDTDNFIIIVPRRFKSETKYDQIFKSPLILVWAPVAAIVSIVRFIFNKIWRTDKNLADISFETFGLSLGSSFGAKISSAAENILLWCFCLGTMLSGMLLSSEMFLGFAMQYDFLTINNLGDLETSGLYVCAPHIFESVNSFRKNTPYKLKWMLKMPYDITDMIQSRNKEYAYVIEESKFNFLFRYDKDTWHVVERFGYHHLSYKLQMYWHFENRMNTLVQRCVENGIVKYLKEKNKRLLTGLKPGQETTDKEVISPRVKPLSLSDMTNSFLLGTLGLLLGAATFIAEIIYFAIYYNIRKMKRKDLPVHYTSP